MLVRKKKRGGGDRPFFLLSAGGPAKKGRGGGRRGEERKKKRGASTFLFSATARGIRKRVRRERRERELTGSAYSPTPLRPPGGKDLRNL